MTKTTLEMIAVMQAYEDGATIIMYGPMADGDVVVSPQWNWALFDYEIAPVRQPIAPWECLPDWVEFVAFDKDMIVVGHELKPETSSYKWFSKGRSILLMGFNDRVLNQGDVTWDKSCIQRPEGSHGRTC